MPQASAHLHPAIYIIERQSKSDSEKTIAFRALFDINCVPCTTYKYRIVLPNNRLRQQLGHGMRKELVLLAVVVTQAMVSVAPLVPAARGQAAIPELVLTIIAGNATQLTFSPDAIRVPQVPILLNITVINHGTVGLHTLTIRDTGGTPRVNLALPAADSRGTVRFQVNASSTGAALGDIFYNGSAFVPERGASGIRFFCVPHESALIDRKSTRLNSSHIQKSRMPSSA